MYIIFNFTGFTEKEKIISTKKKKEEKGRRRRRRSKHAEMRIEKHRERSLCALRRCVSGQIHPEVEELDELSRFGKPD